MANAWSKEERVAWMDMVEGFEDALVLSRNVDVYRTNATSMERSSNEVWRPVPYIAQSYAGTDMTSNFNDATQLSVPSNINIPRSSPWTMSSTDLNDPLQVDRQRRAAIQKLSSDINLSVMNVAANEGTLVVSRSTAATGFDDVAQCEAIMNEQGVSFDNRYLALSTRDYNGMAGNLAARQTLKGKPLTAYDKARIDEVASFDTYKLDYANSLAGATATGVSVNGAGQYHTPAATSTAVGGQTSNVDNRTQVLAITVTANTVAVGDCFTIAGVNAVHHITKQSTGQLKTFRITEIITGAGGTGNVRISPAIVSNGGATPAEAQYQNVDSTPADAAAITFLNTQLANVNPFWKKDAIEILPGNVAIPTNAGAEVLTATTDQGFQLRYSKQFNINDLTTKYRIDVFYGVVMTNPEMCGIMLFSQT